MFECLQLDNPVQKVTKNQAAKKNQEFGLSDYLVSEKMREVYTRYCFSFLSSFTNAGHIKIIIIKNGKDAAIEIVCSGFKLPADKSK